MWRLTRRLPKRIQRLFDVRIGHISGVGPAASSALPWRATDNPHDPERPKTSE